MLAGGDSIIKTQDNKANAEMQVFLWRLLGAVSGP